MKHDEKQPDFWDYFGYIIAATILIPVGIWLKQSGIWSSWMATIFGY